MKQTYESEVLYKLMEREGIFNPSSVPPYESEIKQYFIEQINLAYPKLTDYEAEWLLYNYIEYIPADFPIESTSNVTQCQFDNVVPYAYKSAILKGSTKYRDIDTGEVLDAFEDGRNLELVSVKMPVLKATGKNLCDEVFELGTITNGVAINSPLNKKTRRSVNFYDIKGVQKLTLSGTLRVYGDTTAIIFYNLNKEYISTVEFPRIGGTTSVPENAHFAKIRFGDADSNINVQLEEGSTATPYEPYKSNILTVNEDVELRGIGDVRDELNLLTGEVTERIKRLNDEDWIINYNINEYICFITTNGIANTTFIPICNILKYSDGGNTDEEFISMSMATGKIIVAIKKSRLQNITVEDFKKLISTNTIEIFYVSKEKDVKTVDLTVVNQDGEECYFIPIEGTMHMSTNGQPIKPLLDVEVPVEAITQNLASFINMKINDEGE